MITINNYFSEISKIGVSTLPDTLRKSHEFVVKSTSNGTSWDAYNKNETIHRTVDLYLEKLNQFAPSISDKKTEVQKSRPASKRNPAKSQQTSTRAKSQRSKVSVTSNRPTTSAKKVGHLREEIKFIRRYIALHNKVKSPQSILSLVKSLQRAIVQKLIKKTSPLAKEVEAIQEKLVTMFNSMKGELKVHINEKDLNQLISIVGGEEVYPSIKLIKRFVGMQGKEFEDKRIEAFIRALENAVKNKKVLKEDPYADKLNEVYKKFKKRTSRTVSLTKTELSGLEAIAKDCSCKKDLGKIYRTRGRKLRQCMTKNYSDARKGACSHHKGLSGVLTAEEMANRQFEILAFQEPWLSLMGRPAKNFSIMFHGDPSSGKTTLLLKFGEYLALNFGRVIYISSEEFEASTLTDKINALLKPIPANLEFAASINDVDLSAYDFIILDSVNDLGLKLDDYKKLRKQNNHAAFILILQHTKDGQYRGGKDWEHDVQIAAKVENGVVTVYRSRYGVKGSLNFFDHFNTKVSNQNQLKPYPVYGTMDDHTHM